MIYVCKKFLKKTFFNPKALMNFRNSLKISLSQDPLCFHNKEKNLPRTQCAPPTPAPYSSRMFISIPDAIWIRFVDKENISLYDRNTNNQTMIIKEIN